MVYRGIAPDTFTDGVDVVVEGRLAARRHLPRDDAARQVRVALRERARREDKYKQTPGYKAGDAGVILVGELSLWVALLMAAWAAVVVRRRLHSAARISSTSGDAGLYATFAMIVLASIGLWTALLTHDFSLKYVASYTSANMPKVYKFTAFWGGQAGSMLFWALILALYSAVAIWSAIARQRATSMPWACRHARR